MLTYKDVREQNRCNASDCSIRHCFGGIRTNTGTAVRSYPNLRRRTLATRKETRITMLCFWSLIYPSLFCVTNLFWGVYLLSHDLFNLNIFL